jgi:hypothetical protein
MSHDSPIKPDWKWGTSEGSREFDRLMDRRLSFREILEWQEEAETLSLRLQSQREADKEKVFALNDKPMPPPR